MEFVEEIQTLGIFDSIDKALDNIYILVLFVTALLIGDAILNAKRNAYYNHDKPKSGGKADKMKGHTLNTKYGFDQKKRLDIDAINKAFMYEHIIAAIIFAIVSIVSSFIVSVNDYAIIAGLIALLASTIIGNMYVNKYLAKKYENVK